jgi:hypothetical protein
VGIIEMVEMVEVVEVNLQNLYAGYIYAVALVGRHAIFLSPFYRKTSPLFPPSLLSSNDAASSSRGRKMISLLSLIY